jgi:hypothetical protein
MSFRLPPKKHLTIKVTERNMATPKIELVDFRKLIFYLQKQNEQLFFNKLK